MDKKDAKFVNILLVEDNPADTRLIKEIFKDFEIKTKIHISIDGIEAFKFLTQNENQNTPDIILLDLNIPCKDSLSY